MDGLRHHLNRLSTDSPEAALHFLRPAFAYAEAGERHDLARLLLATELPEAIGLIIARFDALELDDAALSTLPNDAAHSALRSALAAPNRGLRANALSFIRRRRIVRDAGLLTGASPHASDDVPARGMTLCALVIEGLGGDLEKRLSDGDRALLERAAVAVVSLPGGHRLPSVRLALAMLGHQPGPTLRDAMETRDSVVGAAMRGVVELVDDEQVQRLILPWLGSPVLGRTIARRLVDLVTPDRAPRIFARAELLRTPARRAALRLVERPLRLLPDRVFTDPPHRLNGMLDLLIGLDLTTRTRTERLQRLAECADETTAIRAMLTLAAAGVPDPSTDDRDRTNVTPRSRVRRVLTWRRESTGDLSSADIPHSPLNGVARLRHSSATAESFFSRWRELSISARRVSGRIALSRNRQAFLERTRLALTEWPATDVLAVIDFVRRLALTRDVELELLALAGSRDERIASAAVAAIAASDAPSRPGVLRAAIHRGRGRVRANAMLSESIQTIARVDADREADSRTRINAILASCAEPDEPIASVLRDERPEHRRSALWAAARRGGSQCLIEVKRLQVTESDPLLRERADRAARLLRLRVGSTPGSTDDAPKEVLSC